MQKPSWQQIKRWLAPRLDIPFSRDEANRFLPWIIALMVCLTGLFLAGGVTVNALLENKRTDLSQWLTLQIPADSSHDMDTLTRSVEAVLQQYPAVKAVSAMETEETQELLRPWLGSGDSLAQLPLPRILEVRIDPEEPLDIPTLRQRLQTLSPRIELDTHEKWLDHYLDFIQMLELGAYLLASLIILVTVIMIIFTSKTALKLHEDVVMLLHSIGAQDNYIARQFQFNAFLLGVRGALIGTTMAAILYFILGIFSSGLDSPLLPSLPITGWHVAIWALLPPLTGLLALLVAKRTVLGMLRRMV